MTLPLQLKKELFIINIFFLIEWHVVDTKHKVSFIGLVSSF